MNLFAKYQEPIADFHANKRIPFTNYGILRVYCQKILSPCTIVVDQLAMATTTCTASYLLSPQCTFFFFFYCILSITSPQGFYLLFLFQVSHLEKRAESGCLVFIFILLVCNLISFNLSHQLMKSIRTVLSKNCHCTNL